MNKNVRVDEEPASQGIKRHLITGLEDISRIEKHRPEGVLAGQTIYDSLIAATAQDPAKRAVVMLRQAVGEGNKTVLSFEDYLGSVTQAANLFRSLNGGKPPVVASMLPTLPEGLIVAWGAATAGILMPINPHLEPMMVAALLRASGASILVTTTAHGPSAADRLEEIRAAAPGLTTVLIVDGDDPATDLGRALSKMDARLSFIPNSDPFAVCTYLPTGGTTALPKLARLSQRGMLLNAWIGGAIMGPEADEVVGIGMPLFHVGGLIMLSLRSMIYGQTALLLTSAGFRSRDIVERFWEMARVERMTSLIATPTTAAMLLDGKGDATNHQLRTFTCGGSTIPLELGNAFPKAFGLELREVWGATEFHGFLGCQPNVVEPRIGSVGLRTPWHRVKAVVLNERNQFVREAAPGEQGVIVGAGPCVCEGYLDQSLDGEFFVTGVPDGEIWGSSGDLGRVDEDGFIWIDGRAKDVIIRGGHNIDPKVIEEVLCHHPDVLLAAAIGRPDTSKGELPVAYVQLRPGSSVTSAELLDYCRTEVPERAACPVAIELIDKMPQTAVGKIFKPALRKDIIHRLATDLLSQALTDGPSFTVSLPDSGKRTQLVVRLEYGTDALKAKVKSLFAGFDFETLIEDRSTMRNQESAISA